MTYMPMFECWRVRMEAMAFDVMLDLGHGEDYPVANRHWFFGVRVPLADRREDGLAHDAEAVRLDMVENRIRALVRDREGLYVGRRTGANNRDLLFYMEERPRGLDDRIRASVGMEILFINRDDRDWQGYEQLLPSPRDWRQIEDSKRIAELGLDEASPEEVYEVVHEVVTSINKGAQALAGLFTKLELEEVHTEGDVPMISVKGSQFVTLEPELIARVSYVLANKSAKARGEYLGWTATPIKGAVTESPESDDDLLSLLAGLARSSDAQ
jgi:hypothetical protein